MADYVVTGECPRLSQWFLYLTSKRAIENASKVCKCTVRILVIIDFPVCSSNTILDPDNKSGGISLPKLRQEICTPGIPGGVIAVNQRDWRPANGKVNCRCRFVTHLRHGKRYGEFLTTSGELNVF